MFYIVFGTDIKYSNDLINARRSVTINKINGEEITKFLDSKGAYLSVNSSTQPKAGPLAEMQPSLISTKVTCNFTF